MTRLNLKRIGIRRLVLSVLALMLVGESWVVWAGPMPSTAVATHGEPSPLFPATDWELTSDAAVSRTADAAGLREIRIRSRLDRSWQPGRIWVPDQQEQGNSLPVLIYLHSWSGDYLQDNSTWLNEAKARGWIFVHPNFRGPNSTPNACGSELAQQDVLDALDWVCTQYPVDTSRVYLAGSSGGGHMALLMAGMHSSRFSAVSAWVPITDLAAWHQFHVNNGPSPQYAQMLEGVFGGPPSASQTIRSAYEVRSPVTHLGKIGKLPVDIAAGIHDGKTGSVPIHHALRAFNEIAAIHEEPPIEEEMMDMLWAQGDRPEELARHSFYDKEFGRAIYLRRTAGPCRVSIFEGGHEGIAAAGCAWLEKQTRCAEIKSFPEATD